MDSAIQKNATKLEFATSDKEFLYQYTLREMALSDRTTEINTAIEKTRIESKTEIAQNLISLGLSIDKIVQAMGLDIETVKKLKI
ncbi:hypothetical protein FACS1894172_20990 [Spirochaetia bacterium]|nr:hypothetical protein FACS1894164_15720 [Spirochaetia bacterium]GHU37536.1 hypothetical protein FACS1894172_20990 [Spirochaetia bacterium]